ncbi:hypothetical protein AC1031_021163 [Aphanomyces cochlioides]|nr:hypothetical protein AC1031_021163 [Aphanomyces cochlioides]
MTNKGIARRRAFSGQGYISPNSIQDFGSKHIAQCCRLVYKNASIVCTSLGEPDDDSTSTLTDEVSILPWMLQSLGIRHGELITYELVSDEEITSVDQLHVEILYQFPRTLMPITRQLKYVASGSLFSIRIVGQLYVCRVLDALNTQGHSVVFGEVSAPTSVILRSAAVTPSTDWNHRWDHYPWLQRIQYAGFAGYDTVVTDLLFHLRLALAMDHAAITSNGLLVQGVGGVGKSWLLRTMQSELEKVGIPVVSIDSWSLLLSEDLNHNFANGLDPEGPGVLLLDNVDALFDEGEVTSIGRKLLQQLDLWAGRRVAVIATSTSTLPSTATRTGRLERRFVLDVPTEDMRQSILLRLLHGDKSLASRLAAITGGYVARDLKKIVRRATASAKLTLGSDSPTWLELVKAQGSIEPSQLQDLNVQRPVKAETWDRFAGYTTVKQRLIDLVSYRFEKKAALQRLGVESVSGILLYGPSGCGKSMLVRGLAAASRANFVQVQSSKLLSKYFGETEQSIRSLFARARASAPCLLFFDEIDAITAKRTFGDEGQDASGVFARVLSTLLNEMDGIEGHTTDVIVVAATNRLEALDAALVRPGRMDQAIHLGLPNIVDRVAIFQEYAKAMPLASDVDLVALALLAGDSMTGAGISAVCKEAAFRALRENEDANTVHQRHFTEAMAAVAAQQS